MRVPIMRVPTSPRRVRALASSRWLPAFGLALLAAACQDSRPQQNQQSAHAVGTQVDHPNPLASGSLRFTVDENSGGESSDLKITGMYWGRIVRVRDALGVLQHSNFVIGEDIVSDFSDFTVDTNPITLETTVTIRYPYTPSLVVNGTETSSYQRAFARLDRNVGPVSDKSLDPGELPPYTLLPRNAALVVRFSDLLDEATIDGVNVRLLVGYPPTVPLDARVIADPNHGETRDLDGDGIAEFHTTRVIIDPAVTPFEASVTSPPLSPNAVGLPASITENQPNVVLRIPTRIDGAIGQNSILRNLSGHPVAFNSNGSRDLDSTTNDLVRAVRSGGETELTGDVNNGFLADTTPPKILGSQAIVLGTPVGGPTEFTSTLTYITSGCAMPTKVGDVIQQPGVFAEVLSVALPTGAQIPEVRYRIVFPPNGVMTAGTGTLSTVWDPVVNANKQACFVRFPSIGQAPSTAVASSSSVIVRFNEPMDPESLSTFGTFTVTTVNPSSATPTERQFVVGKITPSSDGQEYRLEPTLPFRHATGSSEAFFVNVPRLAAGPFDLAGNLLANALPVVTFTLDPAGATQTTSAVVLRFTTGDEIGAPNGPEIRGQIQVNLETGELDPRPVVHFAATIDRNNPIVAAMTPSAAGEQTPIANLGSKLMTLWRYCDAGFLLQDETKFNLDVEGLAWAPRGGAVIADTITRFEMALSHSVRLPDEGIVGMTTFPNSGILANFNANVLNTGPDAQKVVHPRARGYVINPAERYVSASGTVLQPFPLNRGLPANEQQFYTWRDTSILQRGGPFGAGAEMAITANLNLSGPAGVPFAVDLVPSIGLPLLMDFRCYPDTNTLGLNVFDSSAVTLNGQPRTRAFSTGGVQTGGIIVTKDPDLEPVATGGFNAAGTPPGATTIGLDNVFYLGEMNLVTRISRAYTIWFDTTISNAEYVAPVVEPSSEKQPEGTSIVLAFRGASNVVATSPALTSATSLDFYGNPALAGDVTFTNNDATWKSTMPGINGSRFFQTRISFIGNAATNLVPKLSALGFAYH